MLLVHRFTPDMYISPLKTRFIFNPLLLLLFPRHEQPLVCESGSERMAFKLKGKSVHHSASFGVLAGAKWATSYVRYIYIQISCV